MDKIKIVVFSLVTAFSLSSCTQDHPAQVIYKGDQKFGKGNSANANSHSGNTYNGATAQNPRKEYPHPVSDSTEGAVKVDSVGISDLAPPKK